MNEAHTLETQVSASAPTLIEHYHTSFMNPDLEVDGAAGFDLAITVVNAMERIDADCATTIDPAGVLFIIKMRYSSYK